MSVLTELRQRLVEYQTAEVTAGALQDISALRLSGIRRGFEKNRAFYEEIRALYEIVRSQAKKSRIEVEAPKPKRVRQLFVAITSNKRFYGALMHEIIEALVREMATTPDATALIVGRVGWQYFEETGSAGRGRRMELAEDMPSPSELAELLRYIETFDRIIVLYPKFINTFRQGVARQDITQSIEVAEVPKDEVGYIFEPEVPAILSFFDTQVRRVLFDRVMLEAELARTSARLIRMEEAQQRAQRLVGVAERRIRREVAAISNTGLLETFAGFTQWKQM